MKKIAFLGGGKVGQAMAAHVLENKSAEIAFIYDPFQKEDTLLGVPVIRELSKACGVRHRGRGQGECGSCPEACVLPALLHDSLP